MNSKFLVYLLLAATAYAGFIYAHQQFDRRAKQEEVAAQTAFDASLLIGNLMRIGVEASPQVSHSLQAAGPQAAALISLLPSEREPWVARVRQLEKRGVKPSNTAKSLHIAFPRGRQIEKPRFLQVNREGVGTAWVTVLESRGQEKANVATSFQVRVNVRQPFPAGFEMKDGHTYELQLSHGEGKATKGSDEFSVLTSDERRDLKNKMPLLRQHIAEAPQVLFMQASLSMSLGLHDNAASVLDRLLKRLGDRGNLSAGILERLVFIYDHRGGLVQVNEALARLKSLR
ncbi:MAG: hypothetical protein ACI97A_003877 [Planctomycetota bacterium]|jgi:hypothetical protein